MFKCVFDTPLGTMLAVSDATKLHSLSFAQGEEFSEESVPILQIRSELKRYFEGTLQTFTTPLAMQGTPFQVDVWKALQEIPFGATKSYQEIAVLIENPLACRAVGLANGKNHFVVIIPCHRVVNANGLIGGYSSGIERKKWLLQHEKDALEIK